MKKEETCDDRRLLQRVKRYQAYQLTYNFKRWMISRFKASKLVVAYLP